MTSNKKVIIITTTENIDQAKSLGKILLNANTCSCINIIPNIYSIYNWNNKIQNSQETMLLIKTLKKNYQTVEDTIKKYHQYDLPEILSINIDEGSKEYLDWLEQQLQVNNSDE